MISLKNILSYEPTERPTVWKVVKRVLSGEEWIELEANYNPETFPLRKDWEVVFVYIGITRYGPATSFGITILPANYKTLPDEVLQQVQIFESIYIKDIDTDAINITRFIISTLDKFTDMEP